MKNKEKDKQTKLTKEMLKKFEEEDDADDFEYSEILTELKGGETLENGNKRNLLL